MEETKLSFKSETIFKYRFVNFEADEKRIIDNNDRFGSFEPTNFEENNYYDTSDFGGEYSEDFTEGLEGEALAGLTGDEDYLASESFDDGAPVPVIKAEPEPAADPGPDFEAMMEEAMAEIEMMKQQAQVEIDEARQNATAKGYSEGLEKGKSEGKTIGYQEGLVQAQEEYEAKAKSLENEYTQLVEKLEPEMVDAITDVFEHVFSIELDSLKGIVMNLALNCIQHVEGSSSYRVHVSPDDYPLVSMQKNQLAEVMGNRNATLDIIEDQVMKKNSCMIETDMGVFDCGLDMQLDSLKKELKLLSYVRT